MLNYLNNNLVLINEYQKYILSRLINKDYDFYKLREIAEKFNAMDDTLKYEENLTDSQVAQNIKEFIDERTIGKKFKIE